MKRTKNFRTSFPHFGENFLTLRYYFRSFGEIKKSKLFDNQIVWMYPERDLNPHDRNDHRILSPACLPVPPPGQKI